VSDDKAERWYWCLRHKRVEPFDGCRSTTRLGPYATPEEAADYAEKVDERNRRWDAEDERWQE
jgi:hypothetical protein